jgi:SHOCT-like domain
MSEEKLKILQMIQEGKINAAEGLELLKALEESETPVQTTTSTAIPSRLANRFLRVRVFTENNTKVNVNLPLSLLKVASKFANFGTRLIPEAAREEMNRKGIDLDQINFEELIEQINEGLVDGKIVDVDVNDPKEGQVKVEVYVD